jgi:hypothetical protein
VAYDRTLLVADNRRCEPKKFGGRFEIFSGGRNFANELDRSRSKSQIPKVLPLKLWMGEMGLWFMLHLQWMGYAIGWM